MMAKGIKTQETLDQEAWRTSLSAEVPALPVLSRVVWQRSHRDGSWHDEPDELV
jgi:hypothetical protein